MYSPEVMSQARPRGDYLRYKSEIGATLSEPVIPVTAREWTQDYEWYVRAPIAAKVGMKPEIIEATRDGRRPTGMSEDEEIVYDFSADAPEGEHAAAGTADGEPIWDHEGDTPVRPSASIEGKARAPSSTDEVIA
jgi:4-carboxymuconolactone decarboxylase